MKSAKLVKEAVKAAGGQQAVADACGVRQPAVWRWAKRGFPRTEWTGETTYARTIVELCRARGRHEFSVEALLDREESDPASAA